ncbi:HAMP domain-containing protein [Dissulfurimicrobium hydrothermale]|uniref:HAMP domain-containing protein n=1 Tax=Dissulfurimicrobium hydrothermale TaxID=1750598 RepID=UPI001EDAB8A7|nr:HAMP domain-containing protein [Dissulfurimicrobium hydrothermale]UKL13805.1 HAMP domain-containing protein [Dissulfurimicrobium hydrothermale]
MKIAYKGSLQRTMIIYFLLIGFASSIIGAEFIYDVHRKELRYELMQNFSKLSDHQIKPDEAFKPIQKIAQKAVLMVVLLLVVVLILLMMFIKNITEPLQHMIEVSKLIGGGDLSHTITVTAKNELAEMGEVINKLTSDLQEIILLSKGVGTTADQFLKRVSAALGAGEISHDRMVQLRHEMKLLGSKTKLLDDIVMNFKFYGIGDRRAG